MWRFFGRESQKGNRGEDIPEPNEGPPDSTRPHGLCPRCGKQSSLESLGRLPLSFETILAAAPGRDMEPTDDPLDQVTVLRCRNCRQGTAVVEEKWVGDQLRPHRRADDVRGPRRAVHRRAVWCPPRGRSAGWPDLGLCARLSVLDHPSREVTRSQPADRGAKDSCRADARFQALLRRMNLPDTAADR